MITQTTLSLDDVAPIVDALADHVGSTLKRPAADDICYATQNRQDAVKEIVSHGRVADPRDRLADELERAAAGRGRRRRAAPTATLIDDENAIDDDLLDGHEIVGLTAGASTPEELVQAVLARLAEGGYDEHEEVTVAREDVHFRLPREVAAR